MRRVGRVSPTPGPTATSQTTAKTRPPVRDHTPPPLPRPPYWPRRPLQDHRAQPFSRVGRKADQRASGSDARHPGNACLDYGAGGVQRPGIPGNHRRLDDRGAEGSLGDQSHGTEQGAKLLKSITKVKTKSGLDWSIAMSARKVSWAGKCPFSRRCGSTRTWRPSFPFLRTSTWLLLPSRRFTTRQPSPQACTRECASVPSPRRVCAFVMIGQRLPNQGNS